MFPYFHPNTRKHGNILALTGNMEGNKMETKSLKALADKVLHGNVRGNSTETSGNPDGNKTKKEEEKILNGNALIDVSNFLHIGRKHGNIEARDMETSAEIESSFDWCRDVCLLASGQRKDCVVISPCPRER